MRLKNIFIIFSIISMGLVFSTDHVLANPSEKYDELKIKLDSLATEMQICSDLASGQGKIDCIDVVTKKMNETKEELDKYAEEIGKQTEELQKDIKSLKNQIGYLDAQVEKTGVEIKVTEQQINLINLDISRNEEEIKNTEKEIENTEGKINETKQKLSTSIKTLYEYDNQNLIKLTFTDGMLSDFFDEIVYIENLQGEIQNTLNGLKNDKKSLEDKKTELDEQKEDLGVKKEDVLSKIENLNETVSDLDESKQQKAILLEITKGDEEKYQELLAEIKSQTDQLLGNLASLSQQRQAEVAALISKYGSIPAGLFNVPIFLQTSYPNEKLGPSSYSFSGYGCAVTSVAMVLASYGLPVDPMTLNKDWLNIFNCSGSSGAFCWSGVTNSPYDMVINYPPGTGHSLGVNVDLDKYFISGRPMIIFLNTSASGTKGHYVVVVGKINDRYVVNDPILPQSPVYLDVSKDNIEEIYNSSVIIDQIIIYTPQ